MRIFTAKTAAEASIITAELAKKAEALGGVNIFCEDKNTLSLELALSQVTNGSFFINVQSFSRYISKHIKAEINTLSKTGSSLLVGKILSDLENELTRFKPTSKPTLASSLYELISQLKSAKVKPDELDKICENEGGVFGSKLKDISLVYEAYEKLLSEEKLFDSSNYLSLMPALVSSDDKLKNSKVIISGYSSLTKQSVDIFKTLTENCDVDFVVVVAKGALYTREMFDKLLHLFPSSLVINSEKQYSKEVELLQKYLFSADAFSFSGENTNKIKIIESKNPYREVENIAKRIRLEVVKNSLRYHDFSIACNDLEGYGRIFEKIFSDFEIPFFVDVKKTLEKHPVVRLSTEILDAVRLNYPIESYLSIARSKLLFDDDLSEAFCMFVKKNAVSRRSIKNTFIPDSLEKLSEADRLFVEKAETVREIIDNMLRIFSKKCAAAEFVDKLSMVLEARVLERSSELEKRLRELDEALIADYSTRASERFFVALDEIKSLCGGKIVTVAEFKHMLLSSAAATEIPMLPQYEDNVFIGDYKSAGRRFSKIIFAVGLDINVPNAKEDCALLCDKELFKMDEYRCVVEPKIRLVNERERENVGLALMSFTDRLYLSYPRMDKIGQPVSKSEVIDYVTAIFSKENLLRREDEARESKAISVKTDIFNYITLKSGIKQLLKDSESFRESTLFDSSIMSAFVQAANDSLSATITEKLLDKNEDDFYLKSGAYNSERLSATVLENYFSCPYACFAKNTLKLNPSESGEVEAFQTGTLFHEVFEKYIADFSKVSTKEESDALTAQIFDNAIKNPFYSRFLNKSKYEFLFKLIKNEAMRKCYEIYLGFSKSSFKPHREEAAFGDYKGAEYKAIKLDTAYGTKKINGKIDRLDRFKDYIRIIDYKTGSVTGKADEKALYSGSSIQLYLYANAFSENSKLGGVYYYKVDDSYTKEGESARNFYGKTLLDKDVFVGTDSELKESLKSNDFNIKVKYENDELVPINSSATLTAEEMRAYTAYALKLAKNGSEELSEGNITPTPYENACEYCEYGGMCGYDKETDSRDRTLPQVKSEDILNAVKEDDNGK